MYERAFHELSEDRVGWGGSYTFRIGVEYMNDRLVAPTGGYSNPCNSVSALNNGAPVQVQIRSGPNVSKNALTTAAGFVDDAWRLNGRVTLSLGMRLDRYQPISRAAGTCRADVPGDGPRPHVQQLGPTRGHERRSHGRRQDCAETPFRNHGTARPPDRCPVAMVATCASRSWALCQNCVTWPLKPRSHTVIYGENLPPASTFFSEPGVCQSLLVHRHPGHLGCNTAYRLARCANDERGRVR